MFAYRAGNGDELTFEEGQKIFFLQDVEDGWAKGELEDGSTGLYPTNFVQVYRAGFGQAAVYSRQTN